MKTILNLKVIAMFIVMMAISANSNSDTTYSQTRIIPKSEPQNAITYQQPARNERDTCNFFDFLCGVGSFVNWFVISPVSTLIFGHEEIDDYSAKSFRFGIGGSYANFTAYEATLCYALKLNTTFQYVPNEKFVFRENIGITLPTGTLFTSDFQRDVFVNGTKIGVETDTSNRYSNITIPIITEVLFRPEGERGSMFFSVGAGPCHIIENLIGTRNFSYQTQIDSISVSNEYWIPYFSIGFGKLLKLGKAFCSFEVKQQLGINPNNKTLSLPGDNSNFLYGFTLLQYELIF